MRCIRHLAWIMLACAACSSGSDSNGRSPSATTESVELGYLRYDTDECLSCRDGLLQTCWLVDHATGAALVDISPSEPEWLRDIAACPRQAPSTRLFQYELQAQLTGDSLPDEAVLAGPFLYEGQAIVTYTRVGPWHYVVGAISADTGFDTPEVNRSVELPAHGADVRAHLEDFLERRTELCPGRTQLTADALAEVAHGGCDLGRQPFTHTSTECDRFVDHRVFDCEQDPEDALDAAETCTQMIASDRGNNTTPSDGELSGPLAREFVDCLIDRPCDEAPDVEACDPRVTGPCSEWSRIARECGESPSSSDSAAESICEPIVADMTSNEQVAFFQCLDDLPCDLFISGYWEEPCLDDA